MKFSESTEAIIYGRVSDPKQETYSPDNQISVATKKLEENGYHPTKIIMPTRSSLSLWDCKEFQELIDEVNTHKYGAICFYHIDRTNAEYWQYAFLMHWVKAAGMRRFSCISAPMDDSEENAAMAELFEHIQISGKKDQVKRTRQSVTDGLHTRMDLGKPSSYHQVWGWDFKHKDDNPLAECINVLTPNADWESRRHIVQDLALKEGLSYRKMAKACYANGIETPKHKQHWTTRGLSNIIIDPINAGHYADNKTATYRETDNDLPKTIRLPESEWKYIDSMVIEKPLITWEQREMLKDRYRVEHKQYNERNTKDIRRFRCMITTNDETRHWIPTKDKNGVKYVDPITGRSIHESILSKSVGDTIREIFSRTGNPFWQKLEKIEKNNRPQLDADLKRQTKELDKIEDELADLQIRRKEIQPSVWNKAIKKVEDRQSNIQKSISEIQNQIAQSNSVKQKVASFLVVRDQFLDVIKHGNEDNARWYALLKTLGCEIVMMTPDVYELNQKFAVKTLAYLKENGESIQGKSNWLAFDSPENWQYRDASDESFITTLSLKRRKDAYPFRTVLILKGGMAVQPNQIARIVSGSLDSKSKVMYNGVMPAISSIISTIRPVNPI